MGTPPGAPPRMCQAQDTHDEFICQSAAESGRLYCPDHSEERTFAEDTVGDELDEPPVIGGLPFSTNRSPNGEEADAPPGGSCCSAPSDEADYADGDTSPDRALSSISSDEVEIDDAPLGGDCQAQNRQRTEFICAEAAEPGCKYCAKHQDALDENVHSKEQADGIHMTICQSRCDCGTPGYIRTRCPQAAVTGTNWCKEHTFPREPGCMF